MGKGKTFGPFTQGSFKTFNNWYITKRHFKLEYAKHCQKRYAWNIILVIVKVHVNSKMLTRKYPKHVKALEEVLKGKNQTKVFTKKLEEEMHQAAELQQFERAKDIRDTLIRLG